jgi:hypothetical protein
LGGVEEAPSDAGRNSEDSMKEPRIDRMVPVFGITSHQEAVSHYVDWLGFNLDWEWREAPGLPVIMAISRDNVAFMLNEHRDSPAAADVRLQVNNLKELADEWNERRPCLFSLFVRRVSDPSAESSNPTDQAASCHSYR